MKKLDLVVVNPGSRAELYQMLGEELTAIEPPLWSGLIAKFARKKGLSVRILDCELENLTPAATAARIKEMNPALAAIVVYGHHPSASTQNMTGTGQICLQLKESAPEIPTVLIGGHVAALPEKTMKEEACDFVCQGEGPYTVLGLVDYLKAAGPKSLEQVPGLWYRENGGLKSTAPAGLIKDLAEDLPGLPWDLLPPLTNYRAHNWHCFSNHNERTPYASIYTSLGCPFKCTFCCINAPFGKSMIRYRKPENVMEEITYLVEEQGVRNIKIIDEMFVLHERHVLKLCDLIIERGFDLNIWAYARIDTVKDHMLEKLKKAGIQWLALGIESGSEHVRDGADKSFGQEDIRNIVKKIQDAGIYVIGNYIFGLPDDNHETMQATLDLALELNCEFANIYSAMAYPGSPLYAMAVKNNWPLPKKWSGYSQQSEDCLPLPTQYLSSAEVLRFRDKAFHIYFSNPRYLEMIRQKFGEKTVQHIREMERVRLKRLYA